MAFSDWFKRTRTYDCLLIDEVPDGMPVTEGDLKKLTLDGDSFLDKHHGVLYTRDRDTRPIRIKIDKKIKDIYLIAGRCGASLGVVMINEGLKVRRYQIAGQVVPLTVDDLVLKCWVDPILSYNIMDNNGLKSLTKQNLLGFEIFMLLMVGIILGWFIIGPAMNFLISYFLHAIMSLFGGH